MTTNDCYVDLQEKFEKIRKLIKEDSKLDSINESYLSKYDAQQYLIGMKANIENLLRSQTPDTKEFLKLTAMLAIVLLYLGRISIETEKKSTDDKHLQECADIIDKHELRPEIIMITLHVLNELGLLWAIRDPTKSKLYLEKCEQFYKEFKESGEVPLDFHVLFQVNPVVDELSAFKSLEKTHTATLYYLAKTYESLGDSLKSAIFCHNLLKRQLEMNDYDCLVWALNAARVSQLFLEKNGFKQARHHLAASFYMLEMYQRELNETDKQSDEFDSKVEKFKHRSADVGRCWVQYGLVLLSNSHDRLMNHKNIDTISTDLAKLDLTDTSLSRDDVSNLQFGTLDLSALESQVTDQFLLTLDDARRVFLNAESWLVCALTYYTFDTFASDYIEIVQDLTQLYQNLLLFEESPENRAKMHKRCIDLLENILKQIKPIYHMKHCKQLWIELAETYAAILYIKLDKLKKSPEDISPGTLSKINNFVDKGIYNNNKFIDSFRDVNTNELPNTIPEEYEKPYIKAFRRNGDLYTQYIVVDKEVNLQHFEASLENYKMVLDYCRRNPKAKEASPTEHGICTEMATLLPIKIEKLKQEIPPPCFRCG